jgi:hypothetical protein
MRVTGFENDSRVLVKSQSRKRSRYRKLSTRNRVYRPGGDQINKSNKYDENGCKSLLRGTRMQNGRSNEGTNDCRRLGEARWDAAGDLSFPRVSCWGAGAWLLAWSCLLAFPCGLLDSFHTWLVMPNIQNVPVQKEVRQPGQETARTAGRRAQLSWARVLKCRSQFSRREDDKYDHAAVSIKP